MNYTLHQLQVFLKIAETGSVTRAAESLHLTQPAVSIQLKNLQDQFEIPLTEIIGRKIHITHFGREIAKAAERIIGEVHHINYQVLAHKGLLTGELRISVVSTGKYVIPYFLSSFVKRNPGVELRIDVTNKQKVIQSLEKNEVDFALVSILPEKIKTHSVSLLENKLFLVGPGIKSQQKKKPGLSDLKDVPMIYREEGSGTRLMMESFIQRQQWKTGRVIELSSNEAVKQAVIAGLGYSVMPLIGIRHELVRGDLRIIPVKGLPVQSSWRLVWLQGKQFSPQAAECLRHIDEHKQAIIKEWFEWYGTY